MCCLAAIAGLFGPRLGVLAWYLVQPGRWELAFSSTWVWPLLGSLFAPWTTLMYVAVAAGGVHGFNWFWIVLGVLADLASYTSGSREGWSRVGARR
jgi:hypothetical protein